MKFKDKKPLTKYDIEKKRDTFTIALNSEEREMLEKCKQIIEQVKDGTAIKTLAWIGANVLHDKKTKYIIRTIIDNKRKNKRLNVADFD